MTVPPTILIAEDDPIFRRVVLHSFQSAGYTCITASDGSEAMEALNSNDVDLLVTDYQMPVCSGIELINRIRDHAHLANLSIILCTAKGYELDSESLMAKYKLLAVLRKPVSPKQLIEIVANHLAPLQTNNPNPRDTS